jgi:hypothetical protein
VPDVREVGHVSDIDGLTISICTEGDRVRLEVGSSVALLDQDGTEEFGRVLISACWDAAQHRAPKGRPTW